MTVTDNTTASEAYLAAVRGMPGEQKSGLLAQLESAKARDLVLAKYGNVIDLARAVNPNFVITPALTTIGAAIEGVLNAPPGKVRNLQVNMPPQEGKSTLCAVYTPLRALQRNPNLKVVLVTYGDALAQMHSTTARDIIKRHGSGVVDSLTGATVEDKIGFSLAKGANKVSDWMVAGHDGGLVAVGMGGPITGRPADLLIIDDPYKSAVEADSAAYRAKVDTWFSSVASTRLAPGAPIILIQCMTGDTPVLRPDGTETPLADIRPGDEIATYEDGALSTATVKNWASQGYDRVSKLVFASGRQVRANARHPFLVAHDDGTTEWIRLADLKPGHRVIATSTGANDPTTPEDGASRIGLHCGAPSEDYGFTPRDIGVNGPTSSALLTAATSPPSSSRGCATATMTSTDGRLESGTPRTVGDLAATCCCAGDTASTTTSTTACSPPKTGGALSAALRLTRRVCQRIGTAISAWITTRRPACANCFATTAMSASEGFTTTPHGSALLPTISTDTLLHIEPDGIAEVFDIEVERTENFIANGLVSHNTRWHPEDLSGKVLEGETSLPRSEKTWKFINIPAISEAGIPDALDRPVGVPMQSARDTVDHQRNFAATRRKVGERTWYALYQGSPRNPAGGLFMRSWFEDRRLSGTPILPVASIVGIDPADSGEGDETGIIGATLAGDGTVVLAEDWSGQFTSDEWSTQAVLLALTIGAREIAMEAFTTATTYKKVIERAWDAIHRAAVEKHHAGGRLTPVEQRALAPQMPFTIHKWKMPGDAVARSALLRQACEVGTCRTVEFKLGVFEAQACDWQVGQHQPDRVAAALIAHDRLAALGSGRPTLAAPVNTRPLEAPAWMRRRIGNGN